MAQAIPSDKPMMLMAAYALLRLRLRQAILKWFRSIEKALSRPPKSPNGALGQVPTLICKMLLFLVKKLNVKLFLLSRADK